MDHRTAPAPRATEWPEAWPDTLPACYRSEAFAEDLQELIAPLPQWRAGVPQGQPLGVRDGSTRRWPLEALRRRRVGDDGLPARLGWQGA